MNMSNPIDHLYATLASSGDSRRDLAQAINRALNTWENHPTWLMGLADQLEKLTKHPENPVLTQGGARCVRVATTRVDVPCINGVIIPAGTLVPVEWESSFRAVPEGWPGSRLMHEFAIREHLGLGPVGKSPVGPVRAVVPDCLLRDLQARV